MFIFKILCVISIFLSAIITTPPALPTTEFPDLRADILQGCRIQYISQDFSFQVGTMDSFGGIGVVEIHFANATPLPFLNVSVVVEIHETYDIPFSWAGHFLLDSRTWYLHYPNGSVLGEPHFILPRDRIDPARGTARVVNQSGRVYEGEYGQSKRRYYIDGTRALYRFSVALEFSIKRPHMTITQILPGFVAYCSYSALMVEFSPHLLEIPMFADLGGHGAGDPFKLNDSTFPFRYLPDEPTTSGTTPSALDTTLVVLGVGAGVGGFWLLFRQVTKARRPVSSRARKSPPRHSRSLFPAEKRERSKRP